MIKSILFYLNKPLSSSKLEKVLQQEQLTGFKLVMFGLIETVTRELLSYTNGPKETIDKIICTPKEPIKIDHKLVILKGPEQNTDSFDIRILKGNLLYLPTEEELILCHSMNRLDNNTRYLCLISDTSTLSYKNKVDKVMVKTINNDSLNFILTLDENVNIDYLIRNIKDCRFFMVKRFVLRDKHTEAN